MDSYIDEFYCCGFSYVFGRNNLAHNSWEKSKTEKNFCYIEGERKNIYSYEPVVAHKGFSRKIHNTPTISDDTNSKKYLSLRAEYGNYGNDAFFLVQSERYIFFGVAGSVDDWLEYEIYPAMFPTCLIKHAYNNSIKIIEENEGDSSHYSIKENKANAIYLMHAAFNDLIKYDGKKVFGSATACFGVFNCETRKLNIANLGDCGFYIRNKNGSSFLSPYIMTKRNVPYQLTNPPPKMDETDIIFGRPQDASFYNFQLSEGDYFIVGSNGVWDNVDMQQMESSLKCGTYKNCRFLDICDKESAVDNFAIDFYYEILRNSCLKDGLPRRNNQDKNDLQEENFFGGKFDDVSFMVVLV